MGNIRKTYKWTSGTKPTTFCFILGHSKPIEDYLDNQSFLRKLDTLEVTLIREKKSKYRCVQSQGISLAPSSLGIQRITWQISSKPKLFSP
jgi:hypothetical protein